MVRKSFFEYLPGISDLTNCVQKLTDTPEILVLVGFADERSTRPPNLLRFSS